MITISKDLLIPEALRKDFRAPFGTLMECSEIASLLRREKHHVVSIGDYVSYSLITHGLNPSLIIWDKKTKRLPADAERVRLLESYSPPIQITNPAGRITKEAWDTVSGLLRERRASLLVNGEEDLLTLPVVLNSDDGTRVVYGMPDEGAILIDVDKKIKARFHKVLLKIENEG